MERATDQNIFSQAAKVTALEAGAFATDDNDNRFGLWEHVVEECRHGIRQLVR